MMRWGRRCGVALWVLWCVAASWTACGGPTRDDAEVADAPYPTRPAEGWVLDTTRTLNASQRSELAARLDRLWQARSVRLAVALVPDIGPYRLEAYSLGLFRAWRLGEDTRGRGGLLLVVVQRRLNRIELGSDLAPWVDDEARQQMLVEVFRPTARAEGTAAATVRTLHVLAERLQQVPRGPQPAVVPPAPPAAPWRPPRALIVGGAGVLAVWLLLRRRHRAAQARQRQQWDAEARAALADQLAARIEAETAMFHDAGEADRRRRAFLAAAEAATTEGQLRNLANTHLLPLDAPRQRLARIAPQVPTLAARIEALRQRPAGFNDLLRMVCAPPSPTPGAADLPQVEAAAPLAEALAALKTLLAARPVLVDRCEEALASITLPLRKAEDALQKAHAAAGDLQRLESLFRQHPSSPAAPSVPRADEVTEDRLVAWREALRQDFAALAAQRSPDTPAAKAALKRLSETAEAIRVARVALPPPPAAPPQRSSPLSEDAHSALAVGTVASALAVGTVTSDCAASDCTRYSSDCYSSDCSSDCYSSDCSSDCASSDCSGSSSDW